MTWSTNDGVASTVNLSHSSGAETIFILKRLLKNEGWTVLSSSDGTTYNASGDQITSSGSGAGGMDNSSAWFRIEDPGSLREYVFQRGANHYQWKWIYSASDGFTGGSPDATTIPEADDEQGLAQGSISSQVMFPTTGSWRSHIAAQDAAHNGVYAWWCVSNVSTSEEMTLCCDAINSDTTSNDSDPCIHYGSDDAPIYNSISSQAATGTDTFKAWMRYGEANEEWQGITAPYCVWTGPTIYQPNPITNDFIIDPHDSLSKALPIQWFRHSATGEIIGYKGMGKYINWNPDRGAYTYGDLIQDGSDYFLVWSDLLFPGWPDATAPGI